MDEKDREIQYLKEEIKDLTMRLSTVKIIVNKINPICSEKFKKFLEECEICKGD